MQHQPVLSPLKATKNIRVFPLPVWDANFREQQAIRIG
jgi:hypothetical protein